MRRRQPHHLLPLTRAGYGPNMTAADIAIGDQFRIECACGHYAGPAFALWPRSVLETPLRELAVSGRLKCQTCGARTAKAIVIFQARAWGERDTIWRWSDERGDRAA